MNTPTNTWFEDLPDIPDSTFASYGTDLVSDGTDLFVTAGRGFKQMYKFIISGDSGTWQRLADLPFAPFYGTDLAYANGRILATAGWYQNKVQVLS